MADKFLRCKVVGSIANSITVKPYVDGAEPITVYQQDNILIDPDTLRAEGGELGYMEIEPRPCPFCGGAATLSQRTSGYRLNPVTITNTYRVGCERCSIYTKTYESKIWQDNCGVVQIEANGAMDAIDAWNKRSGDLNE